MTQNSKAVQELESKYPEIAAEYRRISQLQMELFAQKCLDYGVGNISVGTKLETPEEVRLSLTGLWFRMSDKLNRLKNLIALNKNTYVKDESLADSFKDLSVYGIIGQIVHNGKWKG